MYCSTYSSRLVLIAMVSDLDLILGHTHSGLKLFKLNVVISYSNLS